MARSIMKNAALTGKVWAGVTPFPTGFPPKNEVCQYLVDADGLASINDEDREAALKAGFTVFEPESAPLPDPPAPAA
jgi:hypothetical protein